MRHFESFSNNVLLLPLPFLALCLPGLVSETGLASSSDIDICLPCPRGYFQEAAGQRGCLKCPSQVGIEQVSDNNEGGDPLGSATVGLSSILQCPGVEKSTLTTSVSLKKLWCFTRGLRDVTPSHITPLELHLRNLELWKF